MAFLQTLDTSKTSGSNSCASRKMKRLIPDTEKDEKYWEKRLKNNEAAKRSRENKRHQDSILQNKVRHLEEENALLRLELSLLKKRLSIPDAQDVVTKEDLVKYTIDTEHRIVLNGVGDKVSNIHMPVIKSEPKTVSEVSNIILVSPVEPRIPHVITPGNSSRNSDAKPHVTTTDVFNDDRYFRYSRKNLGTPPTAHSPAEIIRKHGSSVGGDSEDNSVPADLSTKNRKRKHEDQVKLIQHIVKRDDESSHCLTLSKCGGPEEIGLSSQWMGKDDYGQELNEKLQRLSDQVLKMQKLVNINN